MKQIIYTSLLALLIGSCATGKKVAFQDDVYDNTRQTKVYATASTDNTEATEELYSDEYYMDETTDQQVVNNYYNCNCNNGGFYDPWRNCRNNSRFGMSVGMGWGNSMWGYNPYGSGYNSPWGYDPYLGWGPNYQNNFGWNNGYAWGYNPYNNVYNPYYYGGASQNNYTLNSNDGYSGSSSVYGKRGGASTSHRGNPNTLGTNNPTYTRSSYTKSNGSTKSNSGSDASTSNAVRQPLSPRGANTVNSGTTERTYTRTNTPTYRSSSTNNNGSYTRSTTTRTRVDYDTPSRSTSPSMSSPSRSSGSSSSPSRSTSSGNSRRP
jgi:hypothetical protein